MWKRLRLAIAAACLVSGWGYIYLPLLFGHCPEDTNAFDADDDPRLMNRSPMPSGVFEARLNDPEVGATASLVTSVSSLAARCRRVEVIKELSDGVILVEDSDASLCSVLNFSHSPFRFRPSALYGDRVVGGEDEVVDGVDLGVWAA